MMIEEKVIYHGHLVHPDIWMLWASFFMAAINTAWLIIWAVIGRKK